MGRIILTAQTASGVSEDFIVISDQFAVLTGNANTGSHHITAPSIAGTETATIQKKAADGSYHDYYIDDTLQQVRAGNTGVYVTGVGIYRVNKSATATAVGIEASTNGSP